MNEFDHQSYLLCWILYQVFYTKVYFVASHQLLSGLFGNLITQHYRLIGNVNCQQTALQECIAPTVAMQIFLDVLASLRPILESD